MTYVRTGGQRDVKSEIDDLKKSSSEVKQKKKVVIKGSKSDIAEDEITKIVPRHSVASMSKGSTPSVSPEETKKGTNQPEKEILDKEFHSRKILHEEIKDKKPINELLG